MRLKFEQLEERVVLTDFVFNLDVEISGPETVFAGEEVSYQVAITNTAAEEGVLPVYLRLSLDDLQWRQDGKLWPVPGYRVQFGPEQVVTFTATGRVPEGVDFFNLEAETGDAPSITASKTFLVLDRLADDHTLGVEVSWHAADGYGQIALPWHSRLHSVEVAGDVNHDGLGDAWVIYVQEYDYKVDGQSKFDLRRIRQLVFGAKEKPPFSTSLWLDPAEGELLATIEGLERTNDSSWRNDLPADFDVYGLSDFQRSAIGDIDGDGFEDALTSGPKLLGVGTARILFGPDQRENFVVLGGRDIGQPTNPARFPLEAGTLGDFNGDGFDDFYILAKGESPELLYVLHGRDFGRDLPADIDRDGTVDFADFLVLAYNYGNENVTRSEGDLDGDGLVAFSDFIVLRDTFGQSKADVPTGA